VFRADMLSRPRRWVPWLQLGSAGAYAAVVVAAAELTPGYSHTRQLISELGQVGAPAATLMSAMLLFVGAIALLFALVLYRGSEPALRSATGSLLIAVTGVALMLGGVFRCDERCVPTTFDGWMHILTAIPALLATLIAPFVFAARMRQFPAWRRQARVHVWLGVLALSSLAAAVVAFPAIGWEGVGQRICTLVPFVWASVLAVSAIRGPGDLRQDRFPPGPTGLEALRYLGVRRRLLDFVERCQRDYGGIVGIRILRTRVCLISDAALIERLFVHHAARIKKWDLGQFDLLLGKGLLTSQGELWRRQRRLIQPVFLPSRLDAYTGAVLSHADGMVESWPDDGVLDIHHESLRVSLRIAASILFGADSSTVEALVEDTQNRLLGQFERALSGVPIPLAIPTPENLRTRRAIRRLDEAILGLIAERRQSGREGDDFLAALLKQQGEDGVGMDDRQLRDECVTMILAAHETTAATLSWTLWLLALHPEHAEELAAHVRAAVGEARLGHEHAAKLTQVRDVVHESMRLYTPVWAIGRVNTEPIDLGAHRLPTGTQIFLVPYLTHRQSAHFTEPLAFRPERWTQAETRAAAKLAYLPFGAGPRKCVGMHFAMHELVLLVATILRHFRLEIVPGSDVVLQPSVTLRPGGELKLRVRRRERNATGWEPG
jgi:cytochrome P450/hypothetical membrane protein